MPRSQTWYFDCGLAPLTIQVGNGVGNAESEQETDRWLTTLYVAASNGRPREMSELKRVYEALFGPFRDFPDQPAMYRVHYGALWNRVYSELDQAMLCGNLRIERTKEPQVRMHQTPEYIPEEMRPQPLPERPSYFEVRFVDEIGLSIAGLDLIFMCAGQMHRKKTDPSGIARIEGVDASFASVHVVSVSRLAELLEPRWQQVRQGERPQGEGIVQFPLRDELPSIGLESERQKLVVITPDLGKLFVELWDKHARVRHALTDYTISGPVSFQGTTDEQGRLVHPDVPQGDYELTLKVDVNRPPPGTGAAGGQDGADGAAVRHEPQIEEYKTPITVLAASETRPLIRKLGVLPRVVMARMRGMLFDTSKTFVLPTALGALREIRELYERHNPSELLIVGHTDRTDQPAVNDPLSLDRANSLKAYLEDDVDAWLANYNASGKKRWGSREDRLMVSAMPDFASRDEGVDIIRWYQTTRGLQVDGVAGSETRRALVTEYMQLDGVSLRDEPSFHISIRTHGCGENFPLSATGLELDAEAADRQENPVDRRVELFFFDAEFGVKPAPSSPSGQEYLEWRTRSEQDYDFQVEGVGNKAVIIEVQDTLFRTESAVVLPEGETPSGSDHEALSSVGIFATALRFNDEHPGRKLLIAGHADTSGEVAFNQTLSEERAAVVLALLEAGQSGRDTFVNLVNARNTVADYKQILSWCSRAFEDVAFDCDPGPIDDNPYSATEPLRRFQTAYNENKAAIGASVQPDLAVDGSMGPKTWGAIYDVYQFAIAEELGEDAAGVAQLREKLTFVDPESKSLGFSEHHPIDQAHRDAYHSQANRRVEILFFETGEEPDIALAKSDPEISELYLRGVYERKPVGPMLTAKRIRYDLRLFKNPELTEAPEKFRFALSSEQSSWEQVKEVPTDDGNGEFLHIYFSVPTAGSFSLHFLHHAQDRMPIFSGVPFDQLAAIPHGSRFEESPSGEAEAAEDTQELDDAYQEAGEEPVYGRHRSGGSA